METSLNLTMASSITKVLLTRTFVLEHHGRLYRYTERVEEVASMENIETVDLTSENEFDDSNNNASNNNKPDNLGALASIMDYKSDAQDDEEQSITSTINVSPTYYPSPPVYQQTPPELQSPLYRPTTPIYIFNLAPENDEHVK